MRRIAGVLRGWHIDRIYGFNVGRQIVENGGVAIEHSAQRYIDLLSEEQR